MFLDQSIDCCSIPPWLVPNLRTPVRRTSTVPWTWAAAAWTPRRTSSSPFTQNRGSRTWTSSVDPGSRRGKAAQCGAPGPSNRNLYSTEGDDWSREGASIRIRYAKYCVCSASRKFSYYERGRTGHTTQVWSLSQLQSAWSRLLGPPQGMKSCRTTLIIIYFFHWGQGSILTNGKEYWVTAFSPHFC